jgi:hypothetical protein
MKRQMCEENSHICLFAHLLFVAIQRGLAPSDEEMVELIKAEMLVCISACF